ncbi:MAG TPA: DUF1566 domain-containing protein [Polyangiaceae bacterium]|nr:DUF1566 domain-containing protein [Polyangiaceae bacterium]
MASAFGGLRPFAVFSLTLSVLGVVGTACTSDKTRAGVASLCTLNSDCAEGLVCTLGRCHEACRESRDCPEGERCVAVDAVQVCQQPAEATCGSGAQSCGPLTCATDGQCRSSCTVDGDCPTNQVCAAERVCAEKTEVDSTGNLKPAGDAAPGSGGASGAGGASAGGETGAGGLSAGGSTGAGGGTGGSVAVDAGSGGAGAVDSGPKCSDPTPDPCPAGCANTQTDPANCGSCGNVCNIAHATNTCASGSCAMTACVGTFKDCANGIADGCETDVMASDANNCGDCGVKCPVGQACGGGTCADAIVTCASAGVTCAQATCSAGTMAISAGGGIVVDTGNGRRLWTRATRGPTTEPAAEADCAALNLEGITGWRLPASFAELGQTLLYPGGLQGCPTCQPAVDQAAFPDTTAGDYWTSHYNNGRAGYDTVEFCDGRNNYQTDGSGSLPYRCTHDPL